MYNYFFFVVMKFCMVSKHFLCSLLSLEMMVVIMFYIILYASSVSVVESIMCMFFLSMSVCEGSVGLSLLVNMVCSYGNDYLHMMSFMKC